MSGGRQEGDEGQSKTKGWPRGDDSFDVATRCGGMRMRELRLGGNFDHDAMDLQFGGSIARLLRVIHGEGRGHFTVASCMVWHDGTWPILHGCNRGME